MTSTSQKNSNPSPKEQFVFDCGHMLQFCERFNRAPIEDQTESVLEVKLKDLDTRWNKVEASYEKVILAQDELVKPEFKEEAKTNFDVCVDAYYHCISQILNLMKAFRMDNSNVQGFDTSARYSLPPQAITQNMAPDNSNNCIKLPPCDTEVFKGSYEQWPSFRDMFTAVYINHSKLSHVTKLYHLRNKTKGEAGAVVKRYPLSHDNFDLAWNALKTRYENKRVLVDNQIKILFDIPAATNENSESIRRIQSSVNDSLATLTTLGVQVESWDPILIRLISTKFPDLTLSLWEQSLTSPRDLPKWSQMSQFLVDRYEAVERIDSIRTSKDNFSLNKSKSPNIQAYTSHENLNVSCMLCNEDHNLRTCRKFRKFSIQQRIDFVYKNNICNNCLGSSHLKANCKSKKTCLFCKKLHDTLLHMTRTSQYPSQNIEKSEKKDIPRNVSEKPSLHVTQIHQTNNQVEGPSGSKQIHANCSTSNENILLRTSLMQIEYRGELFTIRALIDPGSQRTFITGKVRNRLQLPYQKSHFEVIGIGGQKQSANKECEFVLYAKRYNIRIPVKAIVLPKVTKQLPAFSFEILYSMQLEEIDLADPTFNKTSQIDLILGNDYEHSINIAGIKKNICGQTSAYNTIFGWVLSGPMKAQIVQSFTTTVIPADTTDLNTLLKRFWEQEEIPSAPSNSVEDEICERFYAQTTKRNENGRNVVRLPFKKEYPEKIFLGSSRFIALAQYARMEKTLSKNPELHSHYMAVLNEYLALGHMEETSSQEHMSQNKCNSFYLPHHAVVRPEHKTTKVRVVFNASRKTKSQFALNDVLYTGPTLQNDLITVILNWRKYQYVYSGDVQKMYRQILVHPEDRPFQKILFQNQPDGPITV
ncbi:uncharacterized protein LOC135955595 [Calliphora vicina]|uniref:uncharacterized protein LOC135955595 n=1 Tax=Calliphora vicina TaxID=7373 RepID=UPI00325C0614